MAATTVTMNETVGALLRDARDRKGKSLAEAASVTKIPERFLALLESDSLGDLPDDIYAKIFLKTYCKFLGLDTPSVLGLYREQRAFDSSFRRQEPRRHPTPSLAASHMIVTPKLIRSILLGVAVLGLAAYVGVELMKIVTPPNITISTPADGTVTGERAVAIEGATEPEVTLRINGKGVAVGNDGNFHDTLILQEGLNTIRIVGAKKHSREMVVTRRIIVQPRPR
ncbi:helix-turn-helix domain-containing protein [Candidatus Uhrbacteria bacterium]|nr:helix-turn-helix domain-containing protein [Candidatus Uhrbacteria bacterium]